MNFTIVVAYDNNKQIGYKNNLLYNIPEDMQNFKKTTLNQVVVMGRKTFESIGIPLKKRINIVLSRNEITVYYLDKVDIYACENYDINNINEIIKKYTTSNEVFIIGGEQIYSYFLPYCSKILATEIDCWTSNCDTYFPEINTNEWKIISKSDIINSINSIKFRYVEYQRKI